MPICVCRFRKPCSAPRAAHGKLAAQTGTALVVTRNGVIEHLYPQPQAPVPTVQEVKPPCETGS